MKKITKKLMIALIFVSAAVTISSCGGNDDNDVNNGKIPSNELSDNAYVNNWILDTMKVYYYWNTQIPSNVSVEQSPDDYFYKLLYKYDEIDGDRFSWIQENYVDLLNGFSGINSGDIGFEYTLFGFSNTNAVWGEVLYVKKGSQAAQKGVKRGMVFTAINGTEITRSNYSSLLDATSQNITFADPVLTSNTISISNEKNILITKAAISENPIFLDSVYNINGNKIGYLVYNFFSSDIGDDSYIYDKELNNVFAKFKSNGITGLVVDLRYNSGGSTLCATYLASMIVKNLNTKNTFYTLKGNKNLGNYEQSFLSSIEGTQINNVGSSINKVYFIVSNGTASASEMVINGLKPYMASNVVCVGDTTVGKTYASLSFYNEKDSRNKWGIQPLIAKFFNSNNAEVPGTGIVPNVYIIEDDIMPKKQLGDIKEELLNTALAGITGMPVTARNRVNTDIKIYETSINKKPYSNKAILQKGAIKRKK